MRLVWIISLLAAAGLAGGCKLVRPDDQAAGPSPTETTPAKQMVLPVAEPPLDREALLLAAARAGSAAVLGADDAAEQSKLAGRRFELRIRFGCEAGADQAGNSKSGWKATFEEPRRILRLRVDPDVNEATPLLRNAAEGALEDATGFWLPSPWLLTAACPPPPPRNEPSPQAAATATTKAKAGSGKAKGADGTAGEVDPPPPVVTPRVGIVQGYGADDPRTHRARQAYEVTRRLAADAEPSAEGYDLVIAGRLRRLPNGKVITCVQEQRGHPPACLIAADFDRIALIRGDNDEQIAEWTGTGGI
jgi:hypothetical protein